MKNLIFKGIVVKMLLMLTIFVLFASRNSWALDFTDATHLTDNPSAQYRSPHISGDFIVWNLRDDGHGGTAIQLFDLSTDRTVTITDYLQRKKDPSISGNLMVYRDKRLNKKKLSSNIYACEYDPVTEKCFENLISQDVYKVSAPTVGSNRIVWTEKKKKNSMVELMYCEYKDGGCEDGTVSLAQGIGRLTKPDVSGSVVVWRELKVVKLKEDKDKKKINKSNDHKSHPLKKQRLLISKIKLVDMNAVENSLNISESADLLFANPRISGTRISWAYMKRDKSAYGIQYCDFDAQKNICPIQEVPLASILPDKNRSLNVSVFGDMIAWQQTLLNSEGMEQTDIFTYDVMEGVIKNVTDDSNKQKKAQLFDDYIVMEDFRFDNRHSQVTLVKNKSLLGITFYGDPNNGNNGQCFGPKVLNVNKVPYAHDKEFTIEVSGAPPSVSATLILSTIPDYVGTNYSGGIFYINLNNRLDTFYATTDATGSLKVKSVLDRVAAGKVLYAQFMFINPSGCAGSGPISTSNAVEIVVQ